MGFDDAVAIVTGGASGIGERCVRRFADAGASVVIADIQDGTPVAEDVDAPAIAVECDVSDEAAVEAMVERTIEEFGSIDVLVNNAGIYASLVPKRDRDFDEIPMDEWRQVLEVNTTGTFLCCQQVVPHMIEQGSGSVVNIASGVSYSGTVGYPHYVASKGAIPPLTRALAAEVGSEGVRVNAVAPGLILSEASQQLPDDYVDNIVDAQCVPRRGRPEDVVDGIEFLASEKASFISGSTIHVDGGLTRR
jgi:NAD(P)-dependent dehydrogenase (short-subunit alcohol dehydrogenase family)